MYHPKRNLLLTLSNVIKDYSPIIIGGDHNAMHRSWNNYSNNTRGVQLYRYLLNNDISLIYSNTFTHKMSRRNALNIDLFLTKDISHIIVLATPRMICHLTTCR